MVVGELTIQVWINLIVEFVLATISTEKLLATEKLVMAFKMIDKDNSGHISKEEIK